ncbi:dRTGG domain protein [Clostridium sp. CAG:1013]|jgi:predicted transcriptional regulator|nr:dRTGG domain protein [Clostridium sp. CAG:1013]
MTVKEMAAALGWTLLAGAEGEDNQIDGCYIGDLLSWVMARAQSGNVWITVMGNVNAIAVATLTDVSCIVLTENAALDKDAAQKAEMQGIPVYGCAANSYDTAVQVYERLK